MLFKLKNILLHNFLLYLKYYDTYPSQNAQKMKIYSRKTKIEYFQLKSLDKWYLRLG